MPENVQSRDWAAISAFFSQGPRAVISDSLLNEWSHCHWPDTQQAKLGQDGADPQTPTLAASTSRVFSWRSIITYLQANCPNYLSSIFPRDITSIKGENVL